MSVARTATGIEGSLLIAANGALVTSAAMIFGEMREFLVPPEEGYWVQLDGSEVDPDKHPKLYAKLKTLPKLDHKWVYAG